MENNGNLNPENKRILKFGVIGTSEISSKMIGAMIRCPKTHPWAIYSRSLAKAEALGQKYPSALPYRCTSLESLVSDAHVDAVYIASPNSLHCEQAVYFLERGIPVLCEKPLGSNLQEVSRMLQAAEKNNVYFAEAYKSRFLPAYQVMKEHLRDLGQIRNVRFDFSKYSSRYDAHKRGEDVNTFKAEFSNGALLDLGVYCLYPVLELFGEPESVTASGVLVPGGVDGLGSAILSYPDFLVTLNYSKVSDCYQRCEIQGENGTMMIDAISSPRTVEIRLRTGEIKVYSPHTEENDMVYECEAFADAVARGERIDAGRILAAFRILDRIREKVGIRYPADDQ